MLKKPKKSGMKGNSQTVLQEIRKLLPPRYKIN